MDPLLLGGLMLGGTLLSNNQSAQNQNEAIQANKEMQQEQNEWNLNLWKLNNEYNLPINQIRRIKAAGLNPALMYGANGSTGISASPAQGVNPARINPVTNSFSGVTDTIGAVFDRMLQQKIAQSGITKNSADSAKALAEAAEAAANAKRAGADTRRINYEIDNLMPSIVNLNDSTVSLNSLKGNLIIQQVDESKARTSELLSKVSLNQSERQLLEKQLAWYDKVQSTTIYVDTLNAISSKRNADSNALSAKSNASLQTLIAEGQKINNELKNLYGKPEARQSLNAQVLHNKLLIKQLRESQVGPLKLSVPDYTLGLPYPWQYNN